MRQMWGGSLLVMAFAAGCGKDDPREVPCTNLRDLMLGCARTRTMNLDGKFFGAEPGLPPVLSELIGMSRADFLGLGPGVFPGNDIPIYANASIVVHINDFTDRVYNVDVQIPRETLNALIALWGGTEPPTNSGTIQMRAMYWDNVKTHRRAVLLIEDAPDRKCTLTIDKLTSFVGLMGAGRLLGVEPVLGRRVGAIRRAYPDVESNNSIIDSYTEHGHTTLSLDTEELPHPNRMLSEEDRYAENAKPVVEYGLDFPYGDAPATHDAIRTQLVAKWGEPIASERRTYGDVETFHVDDERIELVDIVASDKWAIDVRRWRD